MNVLNCPLHSACPSTKTKLTENHANRISGIHYTGALRKNRKGKATTLLFYTSDLEGEFKVVVEGFTHQGEAIRGETSFRVGE